MLRLAVDWCRSAPHICRSLWGRTRRPTVDRSCCVSFSLDPPGDPRGDLLEACRLPVASSGRGSYSAGSSSGTLALVSGAVPALRKRLLPSPAWVQAVMGWTSCLWDVKLCTAGMLYTPLGMSGHKGCCSLLYRLLRSPLTKCWSGWQPAPELEGGKR